jgi:ATP-binding cassette subfamily F protein uup
VLVVSHDRSFLDNVVTSTLVFEPAGEGGPYAVKEYVGGYTDWQRQRPQATAATMPAPRSQAVASAQPQSEQPAPKKKRSFKEQRELDSLPALIDTLETDIASLHAAMAVPDYFRQAGDVLARDQARLRDLEAQLAQAFARWEALEAG